jgi:hypothetical protein
MARDREDLERGCLIYHLEVMDPDKCKHKRVIELNPLYQRRNYREFSYAVDQFAFDLLAYYEIGDM